MPRRGVVSVVVVNYRRHDDTVECVRAFEAVDWPASRLELIVVDNGSEGGSADRLEAALPGVRVVESPVNVGFAGGCNLGARSATGEYLALINNDARPGADWVAPAVAAFEERQATAAVASKVLDWEGRTVDYVDGGLTWFGMGYKREVGQPDTGHFDEPRDVLFATGSAMFVRTDVWQLVGGFDERYFMFYEDVDLGWRLNLLGHRVRYVPGSVAYHRHHASMRSYGSWHEHFLLERNALFTLYKNYEEESLRRALPAALALSVCRGVARGGDDPHALDLARGVAEPDRAVAEVSQETIVPTFAIHDLAAHLPGLDADRRALQSARRRTDAELLPLFRDALEPAFGGAAFLSLYRSIVDAFGIDAAFGTRRRIAVATEEPLTRAMAGPAIRAWAMAEALSLEHEVELVTLRECTLSHPRVRCRSVTQEELRSVERWCDVLVFGGLLMWACPWLVMSHKVLVIDVYDPFHLAQLEQARDAGDEARIAAVDECTTALNAQLARGDLLLCASPRQRDFWLGQMAALGRVNPDTYDEDPTLSTLLTIVPFGLPERPPEHTRPAARGVIPGIDADDELILWGGGIYNWLDPLTAVRAVDRLRRRRPRVRLLFMGLHHPNPAVPRMGMAAATEELAASLELTGTHVFFNPEWVPYDDRQSYLVEADVALSAHHRHLETAFSFRTRVLDYLWASLPVVLSEGDALADLVGRHGAGLVVPVEDVEALEDALFRLLDDPDLAARCRRGAAQLATELRWQVTLEPLLRFCRSPRRAPDLVGPPPAPWAVATRRLRDRVGSARALLRDEGALALADRAYSKVARRLLATS
jgi:GT2 family glycosyltransferase/glycosyltransferase involved in cell wall biosynthesis